MDSSLHLCETTTAIFVACFNVGGKSVHAASDETQIEKVLNPFSYKYHLVKIVVFLKMQHVYINVMTSILSNQPAVQYSYGLFKTHKVKLTIVLFSQTKVIFFPVFWDLNSEERLVLRQIRL